MFLHNEYFWFAKNLDCFTKDVRNDRRHLPHPVHPDGCAAQEFEVRKPIRETFGQMPCTVWRPARSIPSSRAKRGDLPLDCINWRSGGQMPCSVRRPARSIPSSRAKRCDLPLDCINWRPTVRCHARSGDRHDQRIKMPPARLERATD